MSIEYTISDNEAKSSVFEMRDRGFLYKETEGVWFGSTNRNLSKQYRIFAINSPHLQNQNPLTTSIVSHAAISEAFTLFFSKLSIT